MARATSSHTDDLFSLDLSAHNGNQFQRQPSATRENMQDEGISRLVALMSSHTAFEDKLLQAVRRHKADFARPTTATDCAALAELLKADGFWVRQHGPGTENTIRRKGNNCLETLSHNYLTCYGHAAIGSQEEVIIEPRLKDEFQIANPTEKYKALLAALPPEFVGRANKLAVVAEHISQEAARAFQEQGRSLPPWRRTSATLSKWALEPSQASESPFKQSDKTAADGITPATATPNQQQTAPLRSRRSLEFSTTPGKPKCTKRVSALARGLADMQTVQRSQSKRRPETSGRSDKLKRVFSWDFSGMPPITTVRRAGKAH